MDLSEKLAADNLATDLRLFTPAEIVNPRHWPELNQRLVPYYLLTLWWTENFLARPHKDLGRAGPTCPFVRPSLDRNSFWLTAVEGSNPSLEELERCVLGYRDLFLALEPRGGEDAQYKAILILLPDLAPADYERVIDATQKKLKPAFIKQELMIGQFHSLSEEPGVRNPLFRPLKCPVPLLAIRSITAGDVVFMRTENGVYDKDYLKSYLRTFAKGLPPSFVEELAATMTSNGRHESEHHHD
jgi:hypothetical protein